VRSSLPLALLLVYLMVPGAAEATEYVVHWVHHGDSAHAASAGHAERDGDDEHGCSGAYHLCLCHHATGFAAATTRPTLVQPPSIDLPLPAWRLETPRSVELSDIFRPPIA
jgi:hypothetical protein